eukprot:SAG25_NODE_2717_length_1424_cov_2.012830_1_plen_235_part_10
MGKLLTAVRVLLAAQVSAIGGCRCDGYADYFGAIAGKCGGCAPGNVSSWWGENHCNVMAASGKCCDGPYCQLSGAPRCAPPPLVGAPQIPPWKPTWWMNESTIVMPCDYLGFVSEMPGWAETTSKFSVIDIDWSNNKARWANTPAADGRGMTCEEDMVRQAEKIHAQYPGKRTWIYRNIVNGYPWMTTIRKILDDPDGAYDSWFLRFKNGTDGKGPLEHDRDGTYKNPVCDHSFT